MFQFLYYKQFYMHKSAHVNTLEQCAQTIMLFPTNCFYILLISSLSLTLREKINYFWDQLFLLSLHYRGYI
jgi:hypothetical protein